jgi:hypothetical protein
MKIKCMIGLHRYTAPQLKTLILLDWTKTLSCKLNIFYQRCVKCGKFKTNQPYLKEDNRKFNIKCNISHVFSKFMIAYMCDYN